MCKERGYIWGKCQFCLVSPFLENCSISKKSCLNVILLHYLMHGHCTEIVRFSSKWMETVWPCKLSSAGRMLCIMLCSHALSQQKAFWLIGGIKMPLCYSCVCFHESFSIQQPLPPPPIISLFQMVLCHGGFAVSKWVKCLRLFCGFW